MHDGIKFPFKIINDDIVKIFDYVNSINCLKIIILLLAINLKN